MAGPRLLFDIETDGLLDSCTEIHCLVLKNYDTGEVISCTDSAPLGSSYASIEYGLQLMVGADELIGHNVIKFDIPALNKITGYSFSRNQVVDTLVLSRLIWPDTTDQDMVLRSRGKLPGRLMKRHSLEAWGHRLGAFKGDFGSNSDFSSWSDEMQSYCEQDVEVTAKLYKTELDRQPHSEAVSLEHETAWIVAEQERRGFLFNEKAASHLYGDLSLIRSQLESSLKKYFGGRWKNAGRFVPKRSNKRTGYVEGAPLSKTEWKEFDPNSRTEITHRLSRDFGWEPCVFTDKGTPKVDESVLSELPYPPCKDIVRLLTVNKRLGQLAEGNRAWMKVVASDGRIHGGVVTNGAVTGRMTHQFPNLAQVPSVKSDSGEPLLGEAGGWGYECRSLFGSPGFLVGIDASGLEARTLAGYMAGWDNGAYIQAVVYGDKEEGTDIHSVNARALGVNRSTAKTFLYALMYGAGDEKLGWTIGVTGRKEFKRDRMVDVDALKAGKNARTKFLKNIPALGKLTDSVKTRAKDRGFLYGLDRRRLSIRSPHSALNTLLQSAGAILMKRALIILKDDLIASHLGYPDTVAFVANVHDEWQLEVNAPEETALTVGRLGADAIRKAGEYYKFACPLAGDFDVGVSWADTH